MFYYKVTHVAEKHPGNTKKNSPNRLEFVSPGQSVDA